MKRRGLNVSSRELALDRDSSSRFLPWIVAALSLVVVVAAGVTFSLASLGASWGEIGRDRLTVRLAATGEDVEDRTAEALSVLNRHPSVAQSQRLTPIEVAGLLSPWLGALDAEALEDLPLPVIIDVQLTAPDAARDVAGAVQAIPGAIVDSTQGWLTPLSDLAGLAGLVASVLALLAIAVIALVTIFATRAALTAHQATIELLRLMGAEERYIARRMQFHQMRLALLGGVTGTVPGMTIILLGSGAAQLAGSTLLQGFTPPIWGWVAMAALPLLIGLVAMLTARYTVLEMLRNRW